jgi:hypothetical protein
MSNNFPAVDISLILSQSSNNPSSSQSVSSQVESSPPKAVSPETVAKKKRIYSKIGAEYSRKLVGHYYIANGNWGKFWMIDDVKDIVKKLKEQEETKVKDVSEEHIKKKFNLILPQRIRRRTRSSPIEWAQIKGSRLSNISKMMKLT